MSMAEPSFRNGKIPAATTAILVETRQTAGTYHLSDLQVSALQQKHRQLPWGHIGILPIATNHRRVHMLGLASLGMPLRATSGVWDELATRVLYQPRRLLSRGINQV
jgi:hypothetical protein